MASYRYWRSVFIRSAQFNPSGNFATVVMEVQLFDSGGTNLVLGSGGTSSCYPNSISGLPSSLAFDGLITSGSGAWGVNPSGYDPYISWLQFDFGHEVDVATFSWAIEPSNAPQGGWMLASHDGINFDIVSTSMTWTYPTTLPTFHAGTVTAPIAPTGEPLGIVHLSDGVVRAFVTDVVSIGESGDLRADGVGTIAGEVDISGSPNTPIRRKVRLHSANSGACVRETWSDAVTGAYEFTGLDTAQAFYVIAFDYDHSYNAVIKDNIVPEVTP